MDSYLQYSIWALIAGIFILGFLGAPLFLWTALVGGFLARFEAPLWLWTTFGVIALLFNLRFLRRVVISAPLMKFLKSAGFIPKISQTERDALNSGDVWIEQELFSGKPNFKKILSQKYPELTVEEKAFLDGPVEKACQMVNDWNVWQERDLPAEVWEFLKKEKFLGMIIPKEYGGLGFSALAHSAVLMKLSSRSVPLCITVMVPNSLGPAELLNHYGTDEQKKYYLPRLARGEEVPCFALTEPTAGSDAASLQSHGVVFKGNDGKLYLRLNWNKRWITLAAISTVLGLAFRLRDPENLLGQGEDLGITCALIPTKTPGVIADKRHDPLGVPFYNCPTQGKDVVVSIDAIIGGPKMAGKGWKMLMQCLAAGRGISLPAQATAAAKYVARVASNHATVRKQFGVSIGQFEGVMQHLAQITGFAYMLEAARKYTLGGIDSGIHPPVVTAMAKYYFTEIQRTVVNYGMDILGGAGISRGPRNLLAHAYIATPISITVEGANILTRTLIIFGQGALRAHPFAYKEVDAIDRNDANQFDLAFWGHIGHIVRNSFRALLLSLTRGYLAWPYRRGVTGRYYQKLAWASASFALFADVAMGALGAKLKMKGKTTGRFADILAWMYMSSAVLRRFEAEGRKKEDEAFLKWSLDYAFSQIQIAFDELFANFDAPILGKVLAGPVRWYSLLNTIGVKPSDSLEIKLAQAIQRPGEQRDRMTDGLFEPKNSEDQLARLENAFLLTIESEAIARKVHKALKKGILKKMPSVQLYEAAVKANVITQAEHDKIAQAEAARLDVIQVDDFGLGEYLNHVQRVAG